MNVAAAETRTALLGSDLVQLRAYLDDEAAVQAEALEVLRRKERLLAKQDFDGLREILVSAEPLCARMEEMTRVRRRVMQTVGRKLRTPVDDLTLRMVVEHSPADERPAMEAAALKLAGLLKEVSAQNRRNHALVRQGLELNRAFLHVLLGGAPPAASYAADGARVETAAGPSRVWREA
ncbi:MAG TPA: flagellar protein FlgN [Planctomycetota bacterium]|nr:flagellar protein FlgN [Planctomycetota bacterium]